MFWVVLGSFSIIVMIGFLIYSLIDGDRNRSPLYYLVISLIIIFWAFILLFVGYVPKRKRNGLYLLINERALELNEKKKVIINWEAMFLIDKHKYMSGGPGGMVNYNTIDISYYHSINKHETIDRIGNKFETKILRIGIDNYKNRGSLIKNIKLAASHYHIRTDGF